MPKVKSYHQMIEVNAINIDATDDPIEVVYGKYRSILAVESALWNEVGDLVYRLQEIAKMNKKEAKLEITI